MADKDPLIPLHSCVTKFMLDTCRYSAHDDFTWANFFPIMHSAYLKFSHSFDTEVFTSGSSVEFYIKPMLSCIGDTDVMLNFNHALVIPLGHTPPTQLPSHYHQFVGVFEIIDSRQPGYIHLKLSYALRKNSNGCYDIIKVGYVRDGVPWYFAQHENPFHEENAHNILQQFVTNHLAPNKPLLQTLLTPDIVSHGPAVTNVPSSLQKALLYDYLLYSHADCVLFMRCLSWPPQASNWPTRNRDHRWPDHTTINVVLGNGCDVVQAVHPLCRQDEWMRKHQWRLSFSRAEVTLLNNWTPVQQIVYHMLRFVMKHTVLSEDEDPGLPKLCNYHIKTLMLWECEEKPQSWWSAESSLIKLCSSLLHKLSDCVAVKHCQQYFISNCNLLDHFLADDDTASLVISTRLTSLADESVLLSWFIKHYVRKSAQHCPAKVSILFERICCSGKLNRAIDAVVDWRQSTVRQDRYLERYDCESMLLLPTYTVMFSRYTRGVRIVMKELQKVDMLFVDYYTAITSLQVAYTMSVHSLAEDLELLWTLFCTNAVSDTVDTSEYYPEGNLSMIKAIKLAHLGSVGSNALQGLYNEMSKAYLHQSLAYGQESTYSVVHVLLAALYYKSGHYQSAIDHCKQVLNQTTCEQHRLRCIGAEYLPQIDETVDAVLGLTVLYQDVQRSVLNTRVYPQQVPQQVSKLAFTTELLARYLYSKCPTVADSKRNKVTKYRQRLFTSRRPFLCDVLLFKEVKIYMYLDQCTKMPAGIGDISHSGFTDTSPLVKMLELVALEKLTDFRQVMVRELHSQQFPIMNEFAALYAYKCGLLEKCLKMCRNHVNMLLRTDCSRKQRYLVVLPVFICLLDGELPSLFGVTRLLHPELFLLTVSDAISVLTLSLYLIVQCQKKMCRGSLLDSLQLISFLHNRVFPADDNDYFLDRLILKLTYSSLKLYIDNSRCRQ